MKFLILIAVLLISGCSMMTPKIDECGGFDSAAKESYCLLSKEVQAIASATEQSYKDRAITLRQAEKVLEALGKADRILDDVEILLLAGEEKQANSHLNAVRSMLKGLK